MIEDQQHTSCFRVLALIDNFTESALGLNTDLHSKLSEFVVSTKWVTLSSHSLNFSLNLTPSIYEYLCFSFSLTLYLYLYFSLFLLNAELYWRVPPALALSNSVLNLWFSHDFQCKYEVVCSLWGTAWNLKYYLCDIWLQRVETSFSKSIRIWC